MFSDGVSWGSPEDITPEILKNKGIILVDIGDNQILCVINTDDEKGAYWFILNGGYYNSHVLGTGLSAFHLVSQILASPDKKYLAVLSVGEGHPEIEVVNLRELKENKKYKILHEINPYPGGVTMENWEEDKLIINCDVPLTLRKKDGIDSNLIRVDACLLMEKSEKFALDPATGKINSITFDKRKFILDHLHNLSADSKWKRIESVYALKALEAKEAIVEMERILKNEKDMDVIKALRDTIEFLKSKFTVKEN
jgi:hypothetical protein